MQKAFSKEKALELFTDRDAIIQCSTIGAYPLFLHQNRDAQNDQQHDQYNKHTLKKLGRNSRTHKTLSPFG